MRKRILLIKGKSAFEVLRKAADEMAEYWDFSGYDVEVLDLDGADPDAVQAELPELLKTEYAFVFSFQALLFDAQFDNGKSYVDAFQCPYYTIIVDFPVIHEGRIARPMGENIYVFCIDKEQAKFCKNSFPNLKHVEYIPHGGFLTAKSENEWTNRKLSVFFSGNYNDYREQLAELSKEQTEVTRLSYELLDELLKNSEMSYLEGVEELLKRYELETDAEDFYQFCKVFYPIYRVEHEIYREKIIQLLADRGIPVSVVGKNWEKLPLKHPENLHILAENGSDITEVFTYMQQAKIVLNIVPVFKAGAHERIFTAMAAGAVVLCDENAVIRELFEDKEELVLFRESAISEIPSLIRGILSNEKSAEIARRGQKKALCDHMWQERAKEILQKYEEKPKV